MNLKFYYEDYLPQISSDRISFFIEYKSYISFLRSRKLSEKEKLQKHHIIPRSFLPVSWRDTRLADKDNIILVTYSEHKELHRILAYIYPSSGMSIAYLKMCNNQKEFSEKDLRIEVGEAVSKLNKKFYKEHPEKREYLSSIRKGKCFINNGILEKFVYPEEAKSFIEKGWSFGMIKGRSKSEITRSKMKEVNGRWLKGRIHVFNPVTNESKIIYLKDLLFWEDKGWKRGRGKIKYTKPKMRILSKEDHERLRTQNLGRIRIFKGEENKRVKDFEIEEYLSKGWIIGSFYTEEQRAKMRNQILNHPISNSDSIRKSNSRRKGYKWMSKDGISKQIEPEQIESFKSKGWILGRFK